MVIEDLEGIAFLTSFLVLILNIILMSYQVKKMILKINSDISFKKNILKNFGIEHMESYFNACCLIPTSMYLCMFYVLAYYIPPYSALSDRETSVE